MSSNDDIPKKIKKQIHVWAAAGGATAGALPIPTDAIALVAEEVVMVIQIGSHFGISIDKTAAHGILSALVAGVVGTTTHAAAITALEAANLGYPFTIPVKVGIAVGIIELVGFAAYKYFEVQSNKWFHSKSG